MTTVLDDHLLRDYLTQPDGPLRHRLTGEDLATTNLFYFRLCKSASGQGGRALLGTLPPALRVALVPALLELPPQVRIEPMRPLAWRMGQLSSAHRGLSALGAELLAVAERLSATILVHPRNDGRGIRACAKSLGLRYHARSR